MAELNVSRKTIKELLDASKADFLIPDYQRPYAWEASKECLTLWEDLFEFAIPNGNAELFNKDTEEYYLGPIVTFKNDENKLEVIDGQQRLTTIMLLLRAFYSRFGKMKDDLARQLEKNIGCCIWKTDEYDRPDFNRLRIDSQVATDNDKEEFLYILREGVVGEKMKSRYAENYRYFQQKIEEFVQDYPSYFPALPSRILNNCIILPIEADKQDTALRIFSTLNNRGKALSDADIFKSEFYKYYSKQSEKDKFIERWRKLEEICDKIFNPQSGTPMDELFTRYMYYERALQGNKLSTTKALRSFYSENNYKLLKNDTTLSNMELLADFWKDVQEQSDDRFSDRILRRLFVLNYAPNSMWTFFVSVYFLQNKDEQNMLDDENFYTFLCRITAFIWAYAITNPGVNALRTPVYAEMVNVVNGMEVEFTDFQFPEEQTFNQINNYNFFNGRPITKSMLVWWAMENPNQVLPDLDTTFEIEHIFPRRRQEAEKSLSSNGKLESLGNKAILEKRINIRAADYRLCDKKQYYNGYTNSRNKEKKATCNQELLDLVTPKTDYTEADIDARYQDIINAFMENLRKNNLIKLNIQSVIGK